MLSIGYRIRKAREAAGLTQEKLAESVGVSRTAVARWEAGEIEPTVVHLTAVAIALNTTADSLLDIRPGGNPPSADLADRAEQMAAELERLAADLRKIK